MNIKKIIAPLAAAILTLIACEKKTDWGEASIALSKTEISFSKDSDSKEIALSSTRKWVLRERPDWISVNPSSGEPSFDEQTIVIQVLKNEGAPRSCVLTFAGGNKKVDLAITQDGEGTAVEDGLISCADFLAKKDTEKEYTVKGKIGQISTGSKYYGFYVNDGTAELCCPFPSNWDESKDRVHTGNIVTIKGKYEYYSSKQQDQLSNGEILSIEEVSSTDVTKLSVKEFIEKKDAYNTYRLSGSIASSVNTQSCSFTLQDETGSILVYTVNNASEWGTKLNQGDQVTLRGAYMKYNETDEVIDAYIESSEQGASQSTTVEGLVVAVTTRSFLIKTESGHTYVYDSKAAANVKVGDKVKVEGTSSSYNNVPQIVDVTVTTISSGNEVFHPSLTTLNAASLDAYETVFGYVQFEGILTISGNYYNIAVEGATRVGSLVSPASVEASANNCNVTVKGYYVGLSGSNKYFNILLTDIVVGEKVEDDPNNETPVEIKPEEGETLLTLTNAEIQSSIAGGTSYNDLSITSESGTWLANANKAQKYLQIRNNKKSYVTSPEFSSNITRVILKYNEDKMSGTALARTIYAVPKVDPSSLPEDKYNSAGAWDFTKAYGKWEFSVSTAKIQELKFPNDIKQFSILAYDGAVYLDEIYVFIKK